MKIGRKNNLGISLIELLVVVSILSVLSAGLLTGMGMLSGKKAKECITQMDAAIGKTKLETISKSVGAEYLDDLDSYLKIYLADDRTIHAVISIKGAEEDTKIGDANVEVAYIDNVGNMKILDAAGFKIGFDRSTGAFMKTSAGNYVKTIQVSHGIHTYQIEITQETGKYKAQK